MSFSTVLEEGENTKVEFKEVMNENGYKTISAFSNTSGGTLFCGVSDDGNIIGFDCSEESVRKITTKILNKMGIHPIINCFQEHDTKILRIQIEKNTNPISYNGRYYKRVGSSTTEMRDDELKEFFLRGTNWDGITGDYGLEEIDPKTLEIFIKRAINSGRLLDYTTFDIQQILTQLNLIVDGKLTHAAIILFGKNPQKYFNNALIRVMKFKGEISISDRHIKGNLFQQVQEAEEAIKNSINVEYSINDELRRKEIWDYPLKAIRESLLNSIIHRDYFKHGIQNQIKIYEDNIWFFNPGGLFGGMTLEDLKKPHPSATRNPLIADVFFRAGLVEVFGSGIGRILNSLKDNGLPEAEFKEEFGGFSVYLMRKYIYNGETLKGLGLNEDQILALNYVKEHESITMSEFKIVSPDVHERTLRRYLSDLVDKDLIRPIGDKKGRKYVIFNE
jgi:ATP-dependent DNA helicase RecG